MKSFAISKNLERKKLKAEISALRNPGSTSARKSLKSTSMRFGRFLKRRAEILTENLEAMEKKEKRKKTGLKLSDEQFAKEVAFAKKEVSKRRKRKKLRPRVKSSRSRR